MRGKAARVMLSALAPALLSGCLGLAAVYPTECVSSVPICSYSYDKQKIGPWDPKRKAAEGSKIPVFLPEKERFIEEWGTPDERIALSEDEEILVYKDTIWCGIVPIYILPVPLVAPACDGFHRITFKGKTATSIHFRTVAMGGLVIFWPGAGGPVDGQIRCPQPCPIANPTPDATSVTTPPKPLGTQ
ncbi:MAG: hypothetical protein FIB06_10930 [Betaproteobacteria bacterium]|nr:hypothetical protein [Betaproteobacteria bacterium]